MPLLLALLVIALLGAAPVEAADPLAEARRLYNLGQYENAARYAREALKVPATAESARLVLGRIHLERFRRTADQADLAVAREALRAVDATALGRNERVELAIGIGESHFLEDRFGTASEAFERALDTSRALGPAAHDRVLDWWATSLDRLALSRPRDQREAVYARIAARMEEELAANIGLGSAAYWFAAGLRGAGNLDRAWYAAAAGWVNGIFGSDRGAALRADLDRLVQQAIIPERAARLQPRDPRQAASAMLAEWELFKDNWTR
jgi:hypothetical protein